MKKYLRQNKPEYLELNSALWNKRWETKVEESKAKKEKNIPAKWNWFTYNGNAVNQILMPILLEGSKNECAFCSVKLGTINSQLPEIEHFKPKVKYPKLAFEWTNLFPSCHCCNRIKIDIDDCEMLPPDHFEYSENWLEVEENKIIVSKVLCPKNYQELLYNTLRVYELESRVFFRKYIVTNKYNYSK
jgi:uncharacterized protein (TIGR02646 family)